MLTNAEIKRIRSLREKKFRDELSLFVVEGEKMVGEALASGFEVVDVFRVEDIGQKAMERLSQFSTPSSVLAVVRIPEFRSVGPERGRLYLALDSVRDPGNLGTIIRSADWFGVDTVFVSPDTVDTYNSKVVQSSMGSVFRVRVVREDIAGVCRRFKAAGLPVYGTLLEGRDIYAQCLGSEGLVVMGNESEGISGEVRAEIDSPILIPSCEGSGAESLNVAVATAVTLAEFRRRSR